MAIDVAKRWWCPVLILVLNLSCLHAGERWSRQLTEFGNIPGNDWIPLSQPRPGDRQAGAKVLNYFDNTGFLGTDNSAQPQHHQFSFVNQPFPGHQTSRVVFPPPPAAQPLHQELESAFNQPFGNHQSFIQHSPFGGVQTIQRHPPPAQYNQQLQKENLVQEKPSLLDQQFQFPAPAQTQTTNFRQPAVLPAAQQPTGGVSQEEVQLLYVPVETLYNQKPAPPQNTRFNSIPQPVSASLINDFYTAATSTAKPRTTNTPPTTKASLPAKPKPNQPPLAMFMYNDDNKIPKLTTSDALTNLKNVNQITVLDSLSKNLPKVFIGPSGLAPPKGYSKFELPYLSNIDQARLDGKSGQFPFFVAPLSYKTPNGFSKIPLPSPHVGSVIVQQTAASTQSNNYFRQPDNIEYYQPSTLKFNDITTKSPITLPSSKPQYDLDHYTSPTPRPTTTTADRTSYSRGNTQTPQESYRQPNTERALYSHSPFNSVQPNRHVVNEEYFNLAKTKKPTTQSPTPSYTPKSYKPFDFRPIPDQKIPLFPETDDQTPVYTTAKPTTSVTTESTLKSHFKEENFRNRRPYSQSTVSPPYEETEEVTAPIRNNKQEEQHFVHKFKLVDSVRPQTTPAPKSVIDNAFLEFIQQDNHDMVKTVVTNQSPNGGSQIIRNNYFAPTANDDPPKQKFVSTYYAPTTTTSTTLRTTTSTTAAAPVEDNFFKDFEEKSKFYETDLPRFPANARPAPETSFNPRVQTQESFLNRFTEQSYTNKFKYETNTNEEAHYPVEVVTTQEPIRHDTTNEVTSAPQSDQSYSIPSELPPISANLPGLVNSLMEDEWAQKKGEQDSASQVPSTTRGNFRKQIHRTTQAPTTPEPYTAEVPTTRRTRGRRPTTAAGTTSGQDSPAPTRAAPVNRSRSRYVPSSDEKPSTRGRIRSRVQNTPRVAKEEENLDYQRDVLKQNYPVIRPTGSSTTTTTTTTTPPPPPPTTSTTTTFATANPVTYQQIYEEQTERLSPYFVPTEPEHIAEQQPNVEEVSIPRKESFPSENYYTEAEVTSAFPPSTTRGIQIQQQQQQYTPTEDDESVRVLPIEHQQVEQPRREKPVETQREQPVHTGRRQRPTTPKHYEEQPAVATPSYSHEDEQEIQKVEITPRPRRPLSRQQAYSPRTTTERATTSERTTTTTESSSRGSSQQQQQPRRTAFVRRPARPLYTTTTSAPTTTYSSRGSASGGDDEQPTQGSFTVRSKNRQDILRARTRRPATTTVATTTTASPEPPVTRGFARTKDLRRVSPNIRSRQEQKQQQEAETTTTQPAAAGPRFRIRERTRFNLQPQETQWSTKLNQNSFQPVQDIESRSKTNYPEDEQTYNDEQEPEIVTASALQQQNDQDIQLVRVSANMGGPTVDPSGLDGVVMREVALSQEPPRADEHLENRL